MFAAQPPEFYELRYFENREDNTQAKSAIHYIAGLETNFSPQLSLKVEGYYKKMSDLISEQIYDPVNPLTSRENDTRGYCTGMDLQIHYRGTRFYSALSYGFLQAKDSSFGKIIFGIRNAILSDSTTKKIIVRKEEKIIDQIVELHNVKVEGDIVFESGNGKVLLKGNSEVAGRVEGGTSGRQ